MTLLSLRNRNIVPNWRSYGDTILNGELDGTTERERRSQRFDIHQYVEDWKHNNTLSYAGELISAAASNNCPIEGEVLNACQFIINKSDGRPTPLSQFAELLLDSVSKISRENYPTQEPFLDKKKAEKLLQKEIGRWRLAVSRFPYNPISHIELGRAFLQLGMWEKAEREVLIAIHLDPDNRYLTRCAVRCLVHVGKFDKAKYILAKNSYLRADPWLLASDIAVDICRNKTPNHLKYALRMERSRNLSPLSITELALSLATNELLSGGRNKDIRMFVNNGLVRPIDNSLAQAQWISSVNSAIVIENQEKYDLNFDYEVKTFSLFLDSKLMDAYKMSVLWMKDSGFSRRAALTASNLAVYNDKIDESEMILSIGLMANRGDIGLINNLAFVCLLNGKDEKAGKLLEGIKIEDTSGSNRVSLLATNGMYNYRKGNYLAGEALYNQSIQEAKKEKDIVLEQNAMVNHLRERFLAGLMEKEAVEKEIDSIRNPDLQVKIVIEGVRKLIDSKI